MKDDTLFRKWGAEEKAALLKLCEEANAMVLFPGYESIANKLNAKFDNYRSPSACKSKERFLKKKK